MAKAKSAAPILVLRLSVSIMIIPYSISGRFHLGRLRRVIRRSVKN
jgi:hypothetical protein